MSDPILDVDLLAFEQGDAATRRATVDGVMRSLATGFVYCDTDLSETMLDEADGMLETFFSMGAERKERWTVPGSHGQTGRVATQQLVARGGACDPCPTRFPGVVGG